VTRGLNKVLLIGTLGRDPELRYTPTGDAVAMFSLGADRSWVTPQGEPREATEWFNVVAWHGLAELCHRDLHQGARVYVEGHLQNRSWEDDSGTRHFRTEVVASEMILLARADDGAGGAEDTGSDLFEE
jgi:single-strand DNA-binding protein